MVKILFICHNNLYERPRGGEKSTLSILKYLRDFGYECHAIMPALSESDFLSEDMHIYSVRVDKTELGWLSVEKKIRELIEKIQPKVLLTWSSPMLLVRNIAKEFKLPYILFVRAPKIFKEHKQLEECLREATAVITNCHFTTGLIKQKFGIDSLVSYVPVSNEISILENSKEFISMIDLEKVGNDFVEEIAKSMPEEKFLMIDYSLRTGNFEKKNVFYQGYLEDISEIWPKTKIFLFPCLNDESGTSRITMEAMQNGIPTIVQDRGGMKELSPVLVSANATIQDWVSKIRAVEKNWDYYSKKMRAFAFLNHNPDLELEKIRKEIDKIQRNDEKVLYYMKEGIGNLIEIIPSLKAIKSLGFQIDAWVDPTLPDGFDIVEYFPAIDNILKSKPDLSSYKFVLSSFGNFPLKIENRTFKLHRDYSKFEREWYMENARAMGFDGPIPRIHLGYPQRWFDIPQGTVAISPGAVGRGWTFKRWNYFDQLAEYFEHVILVGHKNDIIPEYKWPRRIRNYIGQLSLPDTLALLKQCSAFIGSDGGLAHAAAALGVPTFVIFGPTTPLKNLADGAIMIRKEPKESCQPCQYSQQYRKCEHIKCLRDFSAEEVMKQIEEYLELVPS